MNIAAIKKDLNFLKLRSDVKFFQLTTLGAGANAPLVADVEDDCELVELLRYCVRNSIKLFLIGAGSNLVGSDEPLDGIVVRLRGEFTAFSLNADGRLTTGGGAKLPEVVRQAADRGFRG